jgi:hydrogenase maturation protein HypF
VREPRRSALGLLFALGDAGAEPDAPPRADVLNRMIERGLHSPVTSSAGRLFDAVAAILGVRQAATFEGQAAMELEFLVEQRVDVAYPFELGDGRPAVLNWEAMIRAILGDVKRGVRAGVVAAKFHNTLAEMIVAVARRAGVPCVALTGGCFQNVILLERTVRRLRDEGFEPCWHRRLPPNDGGLSLGQAIAAARMLASSRGDIDHVPGHSR